MHGDMAVSVGMGHQSALAVLRMATGALLAAVALPGTVAVMTTVAVMAAEMLPPTAGCYTLTVAY